MSKGLKSALIVIAVIGVVILMGYSFFAGNYNSMVAMDEEVKGQWAQVQNVYQRRLDLIPNLVATVKGYAAHESKTLTDLAEARAKAGGVMNISDEVLNNPESFKKFQQAQGELSGALQRLLVVSENYPELMANENFLALQDQLEGTENRITTERTRYNETVVSYNKFVRTFPRAMIANMFGFREKPYFAAEDEAQKAPQVSF